MPFAEVERRAVELPLRRPGECAGARPLEFAGHEFVHVGPADSSASGSNFAFCATTRAATASLRHCRGPTASPNWDATSSDCLTRLESNARIFAGFRWAA